MLALWVEFGAFIERTEHQSMLARSDRAAREKYIEELLVCAMRDQQSEKCQEMLYDTRRLLYIPSDALALAFLHRALDLMVHCLRHRHVEAAESEKIAANSRRICLDSASNTALQGSHASTSLKIDAVGKQDCLSLRRRFGVLLGFVGQHHDVFNR